MGGQGFQSFQSLWDYTPFLGGLISIMENPMERQQGGIIAKSNWGLQAGYDPSITL